MSTFYDFLIESAPSLAVVLALAGAIGGLLTYVFRRTVREHDAMVTEVRDIKHENIRLAAETARNSDNWELTRLLVSRSLGAMESQVGGVMLRQDVVEDRFAEVDRQQSDMKRSLSEMQRNQAEMERNQTEYERNQAEMQRSQSELQRSLEAGQRSMMEAREQYAGMREGLGQLRAELREIREQLDAIE